METTHKQDGKVLEIAIKGRLDGYWADHLGAEIDEAIRGGAHDLRLNFAETSYLSSAGIRILVTAYKQLHAINGGFAIANPSTQVRRVIEMTGLGDMLLAGEAVQAARPATVHNNVRMAERGGALFEVIEYAAGGALTCTITGDPGLLEGCRFTEKDATARRYDDTGFALGLGAFGESFADCRERFGEFLAVAGAAAYLPTDRANTSDFMLSSGSFVPEVSVLYGMECSGAFASLARFEAKPDAPVRLSHIAEVALEQSGAAQAGFVVVAESAGLVGAALLRSPAVPTAAAAVPFGHPEIRQWVMFTSERAYPRSLAVIVGVVAKDPHGPLARMLRPIRKDTGVQGHFHAAAFSYRPFKKGSLDHKSTVRTLFEVEQLQGVLHLLSDERTIAGAGESELVRGACWLSPIAEMKEAK